MWEVEALLWPMNRKRDAWRYEVCDGKRGYLMRRFRLNDAEYFISGWSSRRIASNRK